MWKSLFFLWMFAVNAQEPISAILTDIEGTTTSISFVHQTLFPYAKEHMGEYLLAHQDEPVVSELILEVAQIANLSSSALFPVIDTLLAWMEQDKKITPLKTLQGMLWKEGYEKGHFQGHVYLDAFQELNHWHDQGLSLYVYSSGSVAAQKLLFSHSTYGDLTPLFSGYFDTKVGGKKESASYRNIAERLNLHPNHILFLSDVVEELDAAKLAGMQTLLIAREEAAIPDSCSHAIATTFPESL